MKAKIVETGRGVKRKDLEPLTIFSHDPEYKDGTWIALPRSVISSEFFCLPLIASPGYLSKTDPDAICYPSGKLVFED